MLWYHYSYSNKTCHASRKNGAPRRVFDLYKEVIHEL